MLRTILAIAAAATLCMTIGGCGGGDDDLSDAPKGGARRPATENQRQPPGPDMGGEQGGLNTGGDPGTGGEGGEGGGGGGGGGGG